MAQPIAFHLPPHDPRLALRARLETAPEAHAEAVLAAYEILQQLHERGVLDIVRSGLAASDELLDQAVATVNTPEAIRAVRNLLFWRGVLGRIEPDWFQSIFQAIPEGLATVTAERDQPVSLWRLIRRAVNKDSIRGMTAAVDFLESFGRHLRTLEGAAKARTET
jgi:uncharacterized protein YjgD (DUF1641 family)